MAKMPDVMVNLAANVEAVGAALRREEMASMRPSIAARALQGLLAGGDQRAPGAIALDAVVLADALLRALEEREETSDEVDKLRARVHELECERDNAENEVAALDAELAEAQHPLRVGVLRCALEPGHEGLCREADEDHEET